MLRTWLTLALLALVVAALGAWIHYRQPAPPAESHALSNLEPAEVRRIRVEPSGAAPFDLEREADSGMWRITSPFAARADATQVERLLGILKARSAVRLPASDLSRYGLDPPQVKVTLGGETFGYGAVNEPLRERYVLAGDAVYAVALAQRPTAPAAVDALLSRALFAASETPLRFDLDHFTAALEDGAWAFVPSAENAGPDERNAWADAWMRATALRASRHDGSKAPSSITVHFKDGRTVALGVLSRDPELVLVRLDEGVRYHFTPEVAKRLLALPGAAAEAPVK